MVRHVLRQRTFAFNGTARWHILCGRRRRRRKDALRILEGPDMRQELDHKMKTVRSIWPKKKLHKWTTLLWLNLVLLRVLLRGTISKDGHPFLLLEHSSQLSLSSVFIEKNSPFSLTGRCGFVRPSVHREFKTLMLVCPFRG